MDLTVGSRGITDVLFDLCKPVSDYLRENYHPHCSIVITEGGVKIVEDIAGVPFSKKEVEPAEPLLRTPPWKQFPFDD